MAVPLLGMPTDFSHAQVTQDREEQAWRRDILIVPERKTTPESAPEKRKNATPFTFRASASANFTDNALLSNTDTLRASYLGVEMGVGYKRTFGDDLTMDLRATQSVFRYDRSHRELDYETFNARIRVAKQIPKLWDISVFARYDFERQTEMDFLADFLTKHLFAIGFEKTMDWSHGYFYTGYSSSFGIAVPRSYQRNEHGIYVGSWIDLSRTVGADLYYRAAFYDYAQGRADFYQRVTGSLNWNLTKWLGINGNVSFVSDHSNRKRLSYNALDAGGEVVVNLKF